MKTNFLIIVLLLSLCSFAEEVKAHIWDFYTKVSLNIGGSMPIPVPANIQSVESFNSSYVPSIEFRAIKKLNKNWGGSVGIGLDNKGMKTKTIVKEYAMNLEDFKGTFRGNVDTEMNFRYLSLPILAHYSLKKTVSLYAGAYYAYLLKGEFKGDAYNGVLNTGANLVKVGEGSKQHYDFSNEISNHDCGLNVGLNFLPINEHILLSADFNYGLFSVFSDDFNSVDDEMQHVYGKFSIGYKF